MMKKIYFQLLFKHTSKWQLAIIFLSSLVGFAFILFSVQLYIDFNSLLSNNTDLVQSQYTVINKKVGMLNSFNIGSTSFSDEEVADLKKQPFIEKAGIFKPNRFVTTATFSLGDDHGAGSVYLDLFFEAVDDDFVDVQPDHWSWHEGDEVIPLILPSDFINMYNFNYAPGRGLPQISKSTVSLITFNIQIRDRKHEIHPYKGRVVGFSDRIASVLVPGKFLDYANQQYADNQAGSPYRMIVKARNDQMGQLSNYLEKNGYETNAENLRNSKFNNMVFQSLNILAILGMLVILVSLVGFLQFSQLLVNKSKYEIETMNRLGFSYQIPLRFYMRFSLLAYIVILTVAIAAVYIGKAALAKWLAAHGIEIGSDISLTTLVSAISLMILLLIGNYFSLNRQMKEITIPR